MSSDVKLPDLGRSSEIIAFALQWLIANYDDYLEWCEEGDPDCVEAKQTGIAHIQISPTELAALYKLYSEDGLEWLIETAVNVTVDSIKASIRGHLRS